VLAETVVKVGMDMDSVAEVVVVWVAQVEMLLHLQLVMEVLELLIHSVVLHIHLRGVVRVKVTPQPRERLQMVVVLLGHLLRLILAVVVVLVTIPPVAVVVRVL
jgi:hypothetical protein